MNHIVLVNIENNTEKVHRQFSPPFGILIAASVLQRNNVEVIVRHIVNTKENLKFLITTCSYDEICKQFYRTNYFTFYTNIAKLEYFCLLK